MHHLLEQIALEQLKPNQPVVKFEMLEQAYKEEIESKREEIKAESQAPSGRALLGQSDPEKAR